jgi:hypothetical protein
MPKQIPTDGRMPIKRSDLMKDPEERRAWQKLAEELEDLRRANGQDILDLFNGNAQRRWDESFSKLSKAFPELFGSPTPF